MTDLELSLKDLPARAVNEILVILQDVYAVSSAAVSVVIFNAKGTVKMGEITVADTETTLTAKVTALDSEGHETSFDETPSWASSDESVAVVSASEDGYSATFEIGAPGSAVITVTGVESSSGEAVEITSVGTITVTAGDAVVGSVEFEVGGTPEAPPAEEPVV